MATRAPLALLPYVTTMTKKLPTRRLIVRELRQIHKGRTTRGADYTIWQVVATSPDGRAIDANLRTFEELPKNQVIECTVELHQSESYGDSFTLGQVGRVTTDERLTIMDDRLKRLEQHVYGQGAVSAPPPQPAPSPAVPPPPPSPPAQAEAPRAAPPIQRAPAMDNDIPF